MKGYVEYAAPEADPIADLADAVDNSPLQQNKKFVDNTEYYLISVAVIDALLVPEEAEDEDDSPEPQHPGYGTEVEAALARADDEHVDEVPGTYAEGFGDDAPVPVNLDMEVTEEVPGTYDEDHGPDDDEIKDDSDLVGLPDEPAEDDGDIAS